AKAAALAASGGAGQRSLLLAQTDENDGILDLGDALGWQRLDFLDQGLAVGRHVRFLRKAARRIVSAPIALTYAAAGLAICREHPNKVRSAALDRFWIVSRRLGPVGSDITIS